MWSKIRWLIVGGLAVAAVAVVYSVTRSEPAAVIPTEVAVLGKDAVPTEAPAPSETPTATAPPPPTATELATDTPEFIDAPTGTPTPRPTEVREPADTPTPTQQPTPTDETEPADDAPAASTRDYQIVTLLPKDGIPAIFDPQFLTAEQADQWYDAEELVLGVEIGGEARAYSIPFLSRHEIVNDTVGGRKIAVTW